MKSGARFAESFGLRCGMGMISLQGDQLAAAMANAKSEPICV
jgi:hypothetical protein